MRLVFFKSIALLLLCIITFSPILSVVSTAHAEQSQAGNGDPGQASQDQINKANEPASVAAVNSQLQQSPSNQNGGDTDKWCTVATGVSVCLGAIVYMFTVGIAGMFAYMCAYFFDMSVRLALSSNSYALGFITEGWALVRDLANMAFIFILIYIALTIIFKADLSNASRNLVFVILMAVLINFSFFMTRVVIDAGNILALQFYNAIQAPPIGQVNQSNNASVGSGAVGGALTSGDTKDLTFAILGATGVQNILGTNSFKAFASNSNNGFLTVMILEIVLFTSLGLLLAILGVTFLGAGVKFMTRIIIMWFIIIASPIAFAARALVSSNGAKKLFDQWLSALINYGLYPGVFMLVFYIITKFMNEMNQTIPGGLVGQIFTDVNANANAGQATIIATGIANVGIRVGLIVALLYYSLKLCDLVMIKGSDWANSVSTKVSGWASSRGNKLKGFAFQQSAGRLAHGAASGLQQTRFGNSYLGYRVRNNVLGKIASKKVGNARSFAEFNTAKKTEMTERAGNLRNIENGTLVDGIIAAGNLNHLRDSEIARIVNFRQREIDALNARQVEAIAEHSYGRGANFWSDNKMNAVRNGTVFNDAQSEAIYRAWTRAQAARAPGNAPAGGGGNQPQPAAAPNIPPAGGGGGNPPADGGGANPAPGGNPNAGGGAPVADRRNQNWRNNRFVQPAQPPPPAPAGGGMGVNMQQQNAGGMPIGGQPAMAPEGIRGSSPASMTPPPEVANRLQRIEETMREERRLTPTPTESVAPRVELVQVEVPQQHMTGTSLPYTTRETARGTTLPLDKESQALLRQAVRAIETNTSTVSGNLTRLTQETIRARKEQKTQTSEVRGIIKRHSTNQPPGHVTPEVPPEPETR